MNKELTQISSPLAVVQRSREFLARSITNQEEEQRMAREQLALLTDEIAYAKKRLAEYDEFLAKNGGAA